MLELQKSGDSFSLKMDDALLLKQEHGRPVVEFAIGDADIQMHRGNFFINDHQSGGISMMLQSWENAGGCFILQFEGGGARFSMQVSESNGSLAVIPGRMPEGFSRFFFRIHAEKDESVYGCGEQFSSFDLRGRNYPIFVQEQGVGRNKATRITQIADEQDRAGGDYFTTFYAQPTFVSSRNYFCHADTFAYADFDFSNPDFHRLTFWEMPARIVFGVKPTLLQTVQGVSALLGRQGELPDWVYDGLILGIQGGTEVLDEAVRKCRENNLPLCGLWAQDWSGIKHTSFGKRVFWNWQWNRELYPGLPEAMKRWKSQGVRFLGYINPYLLKGTALCDEAEAKGFAATDGQGNVKYVDFGEFDCAIIDFTNPDACSWYGGRVIRNEMIDFGLSGWMADFGEYLPFEAVLRHGEASERHNWWPGAWAKVNHDAVVQAGKQDEIFFFMRAGNAMSPRYCQMAWAGDQNVDWSHDDGLPSVIPAAFSLGFSGMGLHHSDIGGYTTLFGMRRTRELLLRWAAFAAFTPVMRSHEGNRPQDNHQVLSDDDTARQVARFVRLHRRLKPYLKECVRINSQEGIPVMRPLALHYPDKGFSGLQDEYLLGRDLLVAPVMEEHALRRRVVLPEDDWIELYSRKPFSGGEFEIEAPLDRIPVFYRAESGFAQLFASLCKED